MYTTTREAPARQTHSHTNQKNTCTQNAHKHTTLRSTHTRARTRARKHDTSLDKSSLTLGHTHATNAHMHNNDTLGADERQQGILERLCRGLRGGQYGQRAGGPGQGPS